MKLSIKYKFLIGFLLIFILSFFTLNLFLNNVIYKNDENIINNDMTHLQKYSREYIKQLFLINNFKESSLKENGKSIVEELAKNFVINVALYDTKGNFIYEGIAENGPFINLNSEESTLLKLSSIDDLKMAMDNKSAYKINKINGKAIINFSYPLYINGHFYGIIRLTRDYTDLFKSSNHILTLLSYFTLILFVLIFLFAFAISNKIIKPILKLSKALNEVSMGNYDVYIKGETGDEIDSLINSFDEMKSKIKEQIETITEEKEKVLKLEKTRREFFNNVTHELKTPLTTISGYAQIIGEDDFNDKDFLKKAARKIGSESKRLHNMVVSLIEISKKNTIINKKVYHNIDLKPLIRSISDDMKLKADKYNMKIALFLKDNLIVYGNENELKEVFINVIDNAIKYGVNQSTITIDGRLEEKFASIIVTNMISDIDDDILKKAFKPFYRGDIKNEKGSSGLGLYISKTIIEEHNGIIKMAKEDDRVKMIIKIPIWQQSGNI